MSDTNNENSNKAELVKKLEKLIEKIKVCREKDGENYLEECRYVFEMHREAKEAGDPDEDLPMLRERLDIGKSTARKMRKMHEFWDAQSKEVSENFPKIFSKNGKTRLELLCCLKIEKDADNTRGKKFRRFDDLTFEGDVATVKLVNPEQNVSAHEYFDLDLKHVLSSSEPKSKNLRGRSVKAPDNSDFVAQSSECLHPRYKTYPDLMKAYEDLEAEVIEKDKLIAELLASTGQPERVDGIPSTPSAEDQEQTEAEIGHAPGLNSDFNEEAQHSDAVPPKGEEEPSTIQNVEEPSEQNQDDFEIDDDDDDAPEAEASTPAPRSALSSPQPPSEGRYRSLAATPEIPSRAAINREDSSCLLPS